MFVHYLSNDTCHALPHEGKARNGSKIVYCNSFAVVFQTQKSFSQRLAILAALLLHSRCNSIIPLIPLSFYNQKPCTPSLVLWQLSTLTGYHIRCYLQFSLLVIPNVILDIIQPFRTSIMLFTYTPDVTPKLLTFVCIRDNMILSFLDVPFNCW